MDKTLKVVLREENNQQRDWAIASSGRVHFNA